MRFPHPMLAALAAAVLLAACGAGPTAPTAATASAPQEAIVRAGDATIRASAVQTSTLGAEVAGQYAISRDAGTVMLLVAVRKGPDGAEVAVPARVTATATDLRGRRQDVAMRELRVGDLVDYVGTVQTTLPDTLRFDVTIVPEGGASSSMQFTREFFPQ